MRCTCLTPPLNFCMRYMYKSPRTDFPIPFVSERRRASGSRTPGSLDTHANMSAVSLDDVRGTLNILYKTEVTFLYSSHRAFTWIIVINDPLIMSHVIREITTPTGPDCDSPVRARGARADVRVVLWGPEHGSSSARRGANISTHRTYMPIREAFVRAAQVPSSAPLRGPCLPLACCSP